MSKQKKYWFVIGLAGTLLAAPNATIIRYSLANNVNPFLFNVLRFSVIALVTMPFIVSDRKLFNAKNTRQALLAGFFMAIAVICYVWGIKFSQASYVSIITLITPIIFIFYSAKLTGEKITNRAVAGITLAATGAMIIVVLPIAIHQAGTFIFYPLATLFILVNCLAFPFSIISFKKANDNGIPLPSLMCISSCVVLLLNAIFVPLVSSATNTLDSRVVIGIFYSGIVVALVSRIMNIASYEHIGSAVISALYYLETLLAIILPVFLLNEQISVEMMVGGILILLGVYVVEHHKSPHHKHHHAFRTH